MPAKAYADGAVSTPPPKANPAARAAKEAPPDKLIPNWRFLGEVNEFFWMNLRRMDDIPLLLMRGIMRSTHYFYSGAPYANLNAALAYSREQL
jgi:hypothetical protein